MVFGIFFAFFITSFVQAQVLYECWTDACQDAPEVKLLSLRGLAFEAGLKCEDVGGVVEKCASAFQVSSDQGENESIILKFISKEDAGATAVAKVACSGALESLVCQVGSWSCRFNTQDEKGEGDKNHILNMLVQLGDQRCEDHVALSKKEESKQQILWLGESSVSHAVAERPNIQNTIGFHEQLQCLVWSIDLRSCDSHGKAILHIYCDFKAQHCVVNFLYGVLHRKYMLSHAKSICYEGTEPLWVRLSLQNMELGQYYEGGRSAPISRDEPEDTVVRPKVQLIMSKPQCDDKRTNISLVRLFYQKDSSPAGCSYELITVLCRKAPARRQFFIQINDAHMGWCKTLYVANHKSDLGLFWDLSRDELDRNVSSILLGRAVLSLGPSSSFCGDDSVVSVQIGRFGYMSQFSMEWPASTDNLRSLKRQPYGQRIKNFCPTSSGCLALPFDSILGPQYTLQFICDSGTFAVVLRQKNSGSDGRFLRVAQTKIPQELQRFLHYVLYDERIFLHILSTPGKDAPLKPVDISLVKQNCLSVCINWLPQFATQCHIDATIGAPLVLEKTIFFGFEEGGVCLFLQQSLPQEESQLKMRSLEVLFDHKKSIENKKAPLFYIKTHLEERHQAVECYVYEKNGEYSFVWEYAKGRYSIGLGGPADAVEFHVEYVDREIALLMDVKECSGAVRRLVVGAKSDLSSLFFGTEGGAMDVPFEEDFSVEAKEVPGPRRYNMSGQSISLELDRLRQVGSALGDAESYPDIVREAMSMDAGEMALRRQMFWTDSNLSNMRMWGCFFKRVTDGEPKRQDRKPPVRADQEGGAAPQKPRQVNAASHPQSGSLLRVQQPSMAFGHHQPGPLPLVQQPAIDCGQLKFGYLPNATQLLPSVGNQYVSMTPRSIVLNNQSVAYSACADGYWSHHPASYGSNTPRNVYYSGGAVVNELGQTSLQPMWVVMP